MASAVAELAQIPFENIIGGVLKAAVEAQALAAISTVDFIKNVGFVAPATEPGEADPEWTGGDVRNVSFSYKKYDEAGQSTNVQLSVPILAIVPIPFIRIESIVINFKAKLNDITTENRLKSRGFSAGGNFASKKIGLRAGYASQSVSTTSSTQTREYSLDVSVRAVQDGMPSGLSRVLDMLESSMKAASTTLTPAQQLADATTKFAVLFKEANQAANGATVDLATKIATVTP